LTEITVRQQADPARAPIEVVERKGLGHPDTLADALAERMSVAYSRHCLEQFGAVPHHNLDKLYLRGGHARTDLGIFEMTEPVTLQIGGRVPTTFGGRPIGHAEIFEAVARDYLGTVLPNFDHSEWLRFEHATTDRSRFPSWFHPSGHEDLPELASPTASDTAAVTAWWPNTPTESLVLAAERQLNQGGSGPHDRRLSQDVKVMAVRHGQTVDLTISVAAHPMAARDADAYEAIISEAKTTLDHAVAAQLGTDLRYRLQVNSGDLNPYQGKRYYLLGSGSCLEFGEEGFVGRGNGPAGLISLSRPKSAEAAFGKNPTYHSGKVYTIHADQIARSIYNAIGVAATVTIVARHSEPLRSPAVVDVALHGEADQAAVSALVTESLERTDHLSLALQGCLVPR
jgi:S-adenosylmethionine synthetase